MATQNYTYYLVTVMSAILALQALPCYGTAPYEVLYGPEGFIYDVSSGTAGGTCIYEGTNDAYDYAYFLSINGVYYNATSLTISGRNIIGTTEILGGLRVTRKLYVPASKDGALGNFGRWYDSLYNPTTSPITVSVEYFSNLGSDASTVVTGSDNGDTSVDLTDQWFATDDMWDGSEDPSLAHIMYLTGAPEPIDYVELSGGPYGEQGDRITWRYDNVVIKPGQTIAFLTFAVQEKNRAASFEEARGIIDSLTTGNLNGVALRGLSVGEYVNLVNLKPLALDNLQITPLDDSISAGNEGGPFDPPSVVYTLTNAGSTAINWAVEPNVPWLDVNPKTGSLLAGKSTTVTVSINANANILPQGIHNGPVSFTNLTAGVVHKRYLRLMIGIRRVLVYTQYSNISIGCECDNTIKAIDSIGTNFSVTDLNDYTKLSSMLPAHQILLIPEQEKTSLATLFNIGKAWAPVLQNFVSQGGIVVHCDYNQRYGILTGSGLMNITTNSNFSGQSINVLAPDDPIVQGVSSTYTASRNSSHYYTIEGRVIVERPANGPVVIHKMIGHGHVVLIGHDYYESNPNQDRIVGNAVLNLPLLKDDLWVSPSRGVDFSGNRVGGFTPTNRSYTITNVGAAPIEWAATVTQSWLKVEPNNGTLAPYRSPGGGDSQAVVVSITADANSLPVGNYNDVITFTNTTSGYSEIRVARLQVIPIPQEIWVTDTIPPIEDLNMPFGDVVVRQSSPGQIRVWNISPDHELVVSEISTPTVLSKGFFDNFPKNILDQENWTSTSGVPTIDDVGSKEPSPPYSLRLNGHPSGGDAVESCVIDLSGRSGAELRYWWERTGGGDRPDPNDDLIIDYWNGMNWVELRRHLGAGPNMTSFTESVVALPSGAYHENFRLRIRSIGSPDPDKIYDDWFVDNVSISLPVFRLEGLPDLPVVIPPVESIPFDVIFEPMEVNEYDSTVVIKSNDEDEGKIDVLLQGRGIPDWLAVFPAEDFEFYGHPGGPFLPSNKSYRLTNTGPMVIGWTVELKNVLWLNANQTSGSIKPGESTTVVVSPNSQADTMPAGKYIGRLIFTNLTTEAVHKRMVTLNAQTQPKVCVRPQSFNLTMLCGEVRIENLAVENIGDANLVFNLRSREVSFFPASQNEAGTNLAEEINDVNITGNKSQPEIAALLEIPHAENEVLVRFAPQVEADAGEPNIMKSSKVNALLSSLGATIKQQYTIVPGLCLIRLPEGMTVADALSILGEREEVLYVEPNYKYKAHSVIPNDPMFNLLWNLHNTGETGGTAGADVNAPQAWEVATGGDRETIVAVIDTGVDYRHPDLAANMWINKAESNGSPGLDDDRNGYIDDIYGYDFCNSDGDPIDDNGHGTHVSGTIGAVGNNGIGVVGVCWKVKIMAVKFLDEGGSGWDSDAIAAVQYATLMGAKVMNGSWGDGYSKSLEDAIRAAGNAGILFVASAGNDQGNNNDVNPHYPACYSLDNVIAVLSTRYDDKLSAHSNYGPTSIDLGAPGGDSDCEIYSCFREGRYAYMHGTSMASPHVTGACALIWSVSPSLSHLELKDLIMRTVDPLPTLAGRCVSGGRLNLHRAILEAEAAWINFVPNGGNIWPGGVNDVNCVFDANRPLGTYKGQIIVHSNDIYSPDIIIPVTMTVEEVDYFTEAFSFEYPFDPQDPNRNDLANQTLTLVPDGSGNYYRACRSEATRFPVDPADGTIVLLRDDDYKQINLGGEHVDFYGTSYDTIYIGSNGYITFVSGDTSYLENFENHFALPRISALFDDLDPSAGGTISYEQAGDRVVVTFQNVPETGLTSTNSFQIELFTNGKIRITWLGIAAGDGLAGLSEGFGLPQYFVESNLSGYGLSDDIDNDCDTDFADYSILASYWQAENCSLENNWCSGADANKDGKVGLYDLAEFALRWLQ
jgi:subtilisin family serine protease